MSISPETMRSNCTGVSIMKAHVQIGQGIAQRRAGARQRPAHRRGEHIADAQRPGGAARDVAADPFGLPQRGQRRARLVQKSWPARVSATSLRLPRVTSRAPSRSSSRCRRC
jgi:hypothetical protein